MLVGTLLGCGAPRCFMKKWVVVPTFYIFLYILIVGVTPFAILVISPLTFSAAIQIHKICTFSNIFSLTSTRLSHYRHFWTGLQLFTNFPQFWQNCSAILFAGIGVVTSERLQWSRQILQSTSQTSDNALADGWRC